MTCVKLPLRLRIWFFLLDRSRISSWINYHSCHSRAQISWHEINPLDIVKWWLFPLDSPFFPFCCDILWIPYLPFLIIIRPIFPSWWLVSQNWFKGKSAEDTHVHRVKNRDYLQIFRWTNPMENPISFPHDLSFWFIAKAPKNELLTVYPHVLVIFLVLYASWWFLPLNPHKSQVVG